MGEGLFNGRTVRGVSRGKFDLVRSRAIIRAVGNGLAVHDGEGAVVPLTVAPAPLFIVSLSACKAGDKSNLLAYRLCTVKTSRLFAYILLIGNGIERRRCAMNMKEQALKVLHGQTPDILPSYFTTCQIMVCSAYPDMPPHDAGVQGKDAYGVTQVQEGGTWTVDTSVPSVIDDIDSWRDQLVFPDPEAVDWEQVSAIDEKIFHPDRENMVVDLLCTKGIFERMHFLMGFEDTVCSLLTDEDEARAFADAVTDIKLAWIEKMLAYYKPDMLSFQDDYAFKDGLFFSKDTFREIFKPNLKRVVDLVHDHGVIAKIHCCGKMEDLLDEYIELGVDCLDPVQPVNDIVSMLDKAEGKIGLVGGLDFQNVIDRPDATEETIRAEVRRACDTYGGKGPFMLYGASVRQQDPTAYAPGQVMGIVIDEYVNHVLKAARPAA